VLTPETKIGRPERWTYRLRRLEWMAWVVAAVLGAGWLTARGLAWASERRSMAAFHAMERAATGATSAAPRAPLSGPPARLDAPAAPLEGPAAQLAVPPSDVDQSLWDRSRVRAYARALARPSPPPMAVLRIPRLHLEVPVLEGTDEWTLDRGVGHIEGTALPEEVGNVGLAGHRDGFFRVLKDIANGDVLELALPGRVRRYRVEKISIVHQDDVQVLDATDAARLTLVTCYPFYFVGPAPERFIVRAAPE